MFNLIQQAFKLAASGSINELKVLLKEEPKLITSREFEQNATLLIEAAFYGQLEMMQFLLQEGAQINERDQEERTALLWAALNGHLKIVKWLLSPQDRRKESRWCNSFNLCCV